MKTALCHECKHFKNEHYLLGKDMCKLGHKPRFYNPPTMMKYYENNWGWKKKCEDFKVKT